MILDSFKLDGKVAMVTGASRGLGQAIAIALAQAGADVVGVGISNMDSTKEAIEELGRRFIPINADLTNTDCVPTIMEAVTEQVECIDILVNNAGTIRRADLTDFSETDWDDVMNLNLKTLFFLSQAVAKQLIHSDRGGKIVNIASMLSYQGGIRVPSYTASKSAVKGLTMSLANELAAKNINVNAIAPGYMATDNTEQLRNDPVRSSELLGRIPAGRWGKPTDIAGAAVFLASDAAAYVNGYTLAVDGGWLAR